MAVFEYPGYEADVALSKQVLERMERLSKALEKLQNGWVEMARMSILYLEDLIL